VHAAKDEIAAQWGLATHTKSGGYVGWAAMHIRRGATWAINGARGQVSEAELLYAVQAMLENGVPSRCAAAPVRHLVISIAYHKAWVSAAETVKARFPQLTMHHFHDEESWRKVGAALKARGIDFDAFDPVMRDAVEVGHPARTLTRQSLDTAGTRPHLHLPASAIATALSPHTARRSSRVRLRLQVQLWRDAPIFLGCRSSMSEVTFLMRAHDRGFGAMCNIPLQPCYFGTGGMGCSTGVWSGKQCAKDWKYFYDSTGEQRIACTQSQTKPLFYQPSTAEEDESLYVERDNGKRDPYQGRHKLLPPKHPPDLGIRLAPGVGPTPKGKASPSLYRNKASPRKPKARSKPEA
jgi:hypothetical protein